MASSSLSTSAAGNQPQREAYSVVPVQSGVGSRPVSNPSAWRRVECACLPVQSIPQPPPSHQPCVVRSRRLCPRQLAR